MKIRLNHFVDGVTADPQNQSILGVSLMEIGEAKGHDLMIDMKTLETAFAATGGRAIKAFVNHQWNPAPTEVAGVFSGIFIDVPNGKLRAKTFRFLKSFQQHNKAAFETLNELATEHPELFGVSLDASGYAAWRLDDGGEERAIMGADGWQRPEGNTSDQLPRFRIITINSADFVDRPAANSAGLFAAKERNIDEDTNNVSETETQNTSMNYVDIVRELHTAFAAEPDSLARAIALSVANENAKAADIVARIRSEDREKKMAELEAKCQQLKETVEELSAKLQEAERLRAESDHKLKTVAKFGVVPVATESEERSSPPTDRAKLVTQYIALKSQAERIAFCKAHPDFLLSGVKQ